MKKYIAASLFMLLLGVGQAKAGGQVVVFAGYLNPGNLNLDNVRQSLSFRGTSLYGARIEVDVLKGVLGFEHSLEFSPRLFNAALFPNGTSGSDVRGFLDTSNVLINIPIRRLVLYGTGGVGFIKPWGTSFEPFDATFAGNYGGGVKFNKLAGPIGLRFDFRGWRTADIASRGSTNLFEVTGGVTIGW
jgi:hypothetical protein